MYAIVNTGITEQYTDKQLAEAALRELNSGEQGPVYKLFSPASDKTPEQLELLYGLTLELLKVGKINPLFIKLTKIDLLGNETEITALQVINDARAWIDTHVE